MATRLVELYQLGDLVEITLGQGVWLPGRVEKLDHPGVWVVTFGQRLWFVTNRRRIRKRVLEGPDTPSTS